MSRAARAPAPLPGSYWVLPGKLLAGEHPAARTRDETRARLTRLREAGIDAFLDLTEPSELADYTAYLPQGIAYTRLPIRDHGLPARPEEMRRIVTTIEEALHAGRRLYVHCRAGIGRTGMTMGCFLIERGLKPDDALYELNLLWESSGRSRDWPYVPETDEQIEYVRAWRAHLPPTAAPRASEKRAAEPPAARTPDLRAQRERFAGALVGLAVGDALSVPASGREPGTFERVEGYAGSGPDELPPGAWTDDTAMALCLAESLLECGAFDARDQVARYARWKESGHLSATGTAVGMSAGTARALSMAQWRRQAFSGSHDPDQLDPEPLSRVAPAVMFFFNDPEQAVRQACDAARTTSQAPLVLDACRVLATVLHEALRGGSKGEVLGAAERLARHEKLRERMRRAAEHLYQSKRRPPQSGGHDVVEVLESALWAFDRGGSFAEGALLAVNLGGAADVVGAVYGQVAGAHYGLAGIPQGWRKSLKRYDLIEGFAERLWNVPAGQ